MISILMATYNGESYLSEQIESILGQTVQEFQLFIQDDGSSDATYEIAKSYQAKFPNKIFVKRNNVSTGAAKHNFFSLMSKHQDDYIMLSDQDDIWLPDKIEKTLHKLQSLESDYGKDVPIAVHTDLKVVDRDLRVLSESFCNSANMDYSRKGFRYQLVQAIMTGCTVMYNHALSKFFLKEPEFMVMHDWWIMLTASAFGIVDNLNEPTILYRQHGNNAIGAANVNTLIYKLDRLRNWKEVKQSINETYQQANSFLKLFRDQLSTEQIRLLKVFCSIPQKNKLERWKTICELKVYRKGIFRKIAKFLFI